MTLGSAKIAAERRLLPTRGIHASTAAVIGMMTFAILIVAAAGLALTNAATAVSRSVDDRVIVELPAGIPGDLANAVAAVRAQPGISAVRAVPESEMRATLQHWLGDVAASDDLPVPSLITIEVAPGADLQQVRSRVTAQLPNATVIAETDELKPLLGSIRTLQWLALSLVLLVAAAAAAAVVLAARGALDTHRSTIEIMHGIGATDRQLTRLFERKIALDAAAGAVVGTAAAAVALAMLAQRGAALLGFVDSPPLGWGDLLILLALPVLLVLLVALVARWAVLRALRETL